MPNERSAGRRSEAPAGSGHTAIPLAHAIMLAALVALYLGVVPFSITHLDFARDLAYGLDIAQGHDFPLQGPILASTVHFGPIWYYLLAIPLAIRPSWLSAAAVIGVLAALKFPLAYSIGAHLRDRRTGLIWALLLLVPGWMTFEAIAQFHTSLVATCVLAGLWYLIKYAKSGSPAHLFAVGLLFGLGLHAHPSTAGFAWLIGAAIIHRWRRGQPPPLLAYLVLMGGALMPFIPYVMSQAASGFSESRQVIGYLTDERSMGAFRNLASVLVGVFIVGPQIVGDGFWATALRGSVVVPVACGAIYAAGALGLAAALARREQAALALAAIASTLAVALTVALIRAATPFYMTYVIWVFASGMLALGLRECAGLGAMAVAGRAGILLAGALVVVTQASVAGALEEGTYAFGFSPLFDVKQPYEHGEPMPFVPAHATPSIGRLLCRDSAVAAHGILAVHVLHAYAIEARFRCGATTHITIGGGAGQGVRNWTGLSPSFARQLDVAPDAWLGPMGLVPVGRVINPATGEAVPTAPKYPPVEGTFLNPSPHAFEFAAGANEAVVVTNAFFGYSPMPTIVASADGKSVAPSATDHISAAYACADCPEGAAVQWRLVVTTPAIGRVDIVTVRRRGSR